MKHICEAARQTPVYAEADVVVCGGGVAGAAAALGAARNGAKVILLERYGYLGGLATGGLVITVPPLDNGISAEIRTYLETARTYQACPNLGDDDPAVDGLIAIDPEVLKYSLVNMLTTANVRLLLHTYVVGAIVEDGTLRGILVENKAGRSALLAKVVIDCTGDGDVAAAAGAPFELEANLPPITLMANLAGVDSGKALKQIGNWGRLRTLLQSGVRDGLISFDLEPRSKGFAPGVFAADLCYPGEVNLWSGSLFGANGLDPDELTQAEIVTREHAVRLVRFLREHLDGFQEARIEYTAPQLGVRGTRRIVGSVSPTLREVFRTEFTDTVAKPYANRTMRIPYGSLVAQGIDGLLVAGRCMSAQPDAMVQLRLIPVCVATGQAAGTAAALSVQDDVPPRQLDVAIVQQALQEQGMALGLETTASLRSSASTPGDSTARL